MATFDLDRPHLLRDSFAHLRSSRILPLYAAGLFAGAGLGLWLASFGGNGAPADAEATTPRIVAEAPAVVPDISFFEPSDTSFATAEVKPSAVLADPPEWAVLPPVPGAVQPQPEPATDAPTTSPIAAAPAAVPPAPSAPASAPAAPPAPAAPAPAAPEAPAQSLPQAQPQPAPTEAPAPAPEPAKPNFYVPSVPSGPLTSMEQRFFDAANAERAKAGLSPFTLDQGLIVIARTRSQQLVDQGYFGHTDPYGYSMYVELLAYYGYTSYAWAGENLAMNNYSDAESPERAMEALMKSPTHRSNILDTDFHRLGVGLVTVPDGRKFYTMIFLS